MMSIIAMLSDWAWKQSHIQFVTFALLLWDCQSDFLVRYDCKRAGTDQSDEKFLQFKYRIARKCHFQWLWTCHNSMGSPLLCFSYGTLDSYALRAFSQVAHEFVDFSYPSHYLFSRKIGLGLLWAPQVEDTPDLWSLLLHFFATFLVLEYSSLLLPGHP